MSAFDLNEDVLEHAIKSQESKPQNCQPPLEATEENEAGNEAVIRQKEFDVRRNQAQSEGDTSRISRKKQSLQRAKTFIWGLYSIDEKGKGDEVESNEDKGISLTEEETKGVTRTEWILAATLVTDAMLARHSDYKEDEQSIRLYHLFNHPFLRYCLYFCISLNLSLALFETPAVPGMKIPYWGSLTIEICCLFFFIFRFIHMMIFTQRRRFWTDRKNLTVLITIILSFIDIIIYVITLNSSAPQRAIRWSRPLRPLFLVNFAETRQIRRAFRNIRRTLPGVMNVLILFFINIIIFTLMALKLFNKRNLKYPDGSPYFNNFFDSFFDLYVLVTTANNPDIMMPAYDQSKWYVLFFVGYLIICLYIFMSIFLAVIYNNYRKNLKNEVRKSVISKRSQLSRAFELLKLNIKNHEKLSRTRFNTLLGMVPPQRSATLSSLLWFVLDENMDNYIDRTTFLKLADLLNVEVSEVKDRKILLDKYFPKIYNSIPSVYVRKFVQHRYFRYGFDLLIVCNAIFIMTKLEDTDWIFLTLFILEILLKFYSLGFRHFFQRFWNVFDFIVIGTATITTIIQKSSTLYITEGTPTLDALLVLRVLRLIKIVGNIKRFQLIVVTLMHICPFIVIYGGVLFVFFYSFAIIGMEIFGGLIHHQDYNISNDSTSIFCGTSLLNGTDFYKYHYCSNNFNNIINAMVTLFELAVVNQWHVLTSGFVVVTSVFARFYFLAFHLVCVIVVLNIFTAFVLEAFILEYSFHKDKMENAIETKIHELGLGLDNDNPETWILHYTDEEVLINSEEVFVNLEEVDGTLDEGLPNLSQETDIRFHLSKNIRDVEILLQRMFDKEMEEMDIAEEEKNIKNVTNE